MIKKLSVLLLFVLSIPNAQAAIEDPAIQTALKAIYTEAGGDGAGLINTNEVGLRLIHKRMKKNL